jgi:hypothetical protein
MPAKRLSSWQARTSSTPKRDADMAAPYAFLRLQLRAATLLGEVRVIGPPDQGTCIAARFSFENSLQ